jgi:hypothetical protein
VKPEFAARKLLVDITALTAVIRKEVRDSEKRRLGERERERTERLAVILNEVLRCVIQTFRRLSSGTVRAVTTQNTDDIGRKKVLPIRHSVFQYTIWATGWAIRGSNPCRSKRFISSSE